jgi:HK97 family phage portal protein
MVVDRVTQTIRRSGANPALKKASAWSGSSRYNGRTIDDNAALSNTAYYRGVTLIASTIASLPLHVYQKKDDRRQELSTPDTAYLWGRPNIEMTRQSFWERLIADEVRGNAFIFVVKDSDGLPESTWYIDRNRVRVGRTSSGQKVYEIDRELPMIDYREGGEIVHIPNWGGALIGYDPIKVAPQAIALGLSAEEFAFRSFDNGQIPPGIITTDQMLTEKQANELLAMWRKQHNGIKTAQDIGFLGNGSKFQQLSIDIEQMQMESTRRFQVQEVARLLGLPPHLLADVAGSTSWGTGIEEQNRGLIIFTGQAHITRFEQAIDDALLVKDLTGRYVKFDLRGLLRGSTQQRYAAYSMAWGRFMTANEIRALEDMEPIEGGDVLMQPVNMAPLDAFEGMKLGAGGNNSGGQGGNGGN